MRRIFLLFVLTVLSSHAWCQVDDLRLCRSIEDSTERLACYDAAVDAAVQSVKDTEVPIAATPQVEQPAPVPEAAVETPAEKQEVDPETMFGRSEGSIREALEIEEISEIFQQVKTVRRTPTKKLVIVLDNNQVWVQADSDYLNLKPGQEVKIEAGLAGSYYLSKSSGSRAIKVRRAD